MAKGKTTKKDRDRKKREEEERKLKELEEAQARAAEEERIRKEREKIQLAKELARQLEIDKLHTLQKAETIEILENMSDKVILSRQECWETAVWTRYLECRERPDPEDIRQMNTYLSNSKDIQYESIYSTFEWAQESLEIVSEWEWIRDHARHLPLRQIEECDEARLSIENLIQQKLDESAFQILKGANFNLDAETGNFNFHAEKSGICLCIWANLARNPRYKCASFDEGNLKFELPRKLCMVECAVRVLKTTFDHLSPHCSTYQELVVPTFSDTFPPRPKLSDYPDDLLQPEKLEQSWEANKSLSVSSKEDIVLDRGTSQEGMHSSATSLPDEDDVDLREYYIVGDIIQFDLICVPPQPIFGPGWIITKVENLQSLQFLPWLADFQPLALATGGENTAEKSGKKDNEESEKDKLQQFEKLVTVTLKLTDNALWQDTPKLARWIPKRNRWNTKGIFDTSYKDENFLLNFRTDRFGILGCLQPKFSAFPYQSWSLIPDVTDPGKAIFSIATTTAIIEIQIGKGQASLQQVFGNDRYFLQEYYGVNNSPTKLMNMLQSVGIYLTPNKEAQKLTSNIRDKEDTLEMLFYGHIALTSSVFGFCSSRWNGSVGKDKIIVRIKPPNLDKKASGSVVMVEAGKVTMLSITEISQNFNDKPAEDDPASADLYHFVHSVADQGLRTKLENADGLFVDCVYQLMLATRVAVCS